MNKRKRPIDIEEIVGRITIFGVSFIVGFTLSASYFIYKYIIL